MRRTFLAMYCALSLVMSLLTMEVRGQDAPTYSIDYQGVGRGAAPLATLLGGPVPCIKEGDILLAPTPPFLPAPGLVPPPFPFVVITGGPRRAGANLGCPDDPFAVCPGPGMPTGFEVEVDALSYGVDLLILPTGVRAFPVSLSFSVDEHAAGFAAAAPPNVASEGATGTTEAAADVFVRFPGIMPGDPLPALPFAVAPGNTQLFDGNGVAPPAFILPPLPCGGGPCGLALVEPDPFGPAFPDSGTNLDALDVDTITPALAPGPFPIYFSLDETFDDPLDGPAVAPPNSGSALGNFGASGGDVLVTFPSGVTALYAPSFALGLDIAGGFGTDDLDALALAENGDGVFTPSLVPFDWVGGATDMLLFSVRRASFVIGLPDSCFGIPIAPGDVLTTPLAGGGSPFPCLFFAAENLGLMTIRSAFPSNADLDALDVSLDCNGNLIPDIMDIAYGLAPDVDGDRFIDTCCPPLAAPMVGDDTCYAGAVNIGTPCSTDADCAAAELCGLKSRYISITPPLPAGPPECPETAIQVTVVATPPAFAAAIGDEWWAGPSAVILNAPNPALNGAPLQCVPTTVAAPNVQEWPAGVLHLWGAVVIPDASYSVSMCRGLGGPCSAPLLVDTGNWGQIVAPFAGLPNFGDISAAVDKFRALAAAPNTPRPDLTGVGGPGTPNTPNQAVNFADISSDVDAFRGFAYPFAVALCP